MSTRLDHDQVPAGSRLEPNNAKSARGPSAERFSAPGSGWLNAPPPSLYQEHGRSTSFVSAEKQTAYFPVPDRIAIGERTHVRCEVPQSLPPSESLNLQFKKLSPDPTRPPLRVLAILGVRAAKHCQLGASHRIDSYLGSSQNSCPLFPQELQQCRC